uniref:Transposase n=1 Tax=Loa loa TaxID=7209 RepID=A0A1I7VYU7_LOALO
MDNVTLFADETEETLSKHKPMKIIFEEAPMNIRECLSNDKDFNERIPEYGKAKTNKESFLGIKWIDKSDVIRITLKP